MSLPPETIHVKRKRGIDDSPVDFLRLEGSKRHRILSEEVAWVYRRKQPEALKQPEEPKPVRRQPEGPPVVQTSKPGDEKRRIKQPHSKLSKVSNYKAPDTKGSVSPPAKEPSPEPASESDQSERPTSHAFDGIRRFHLTTSSTPEAAHGTSRKRKGPAVFVERSIKRQRSDLLQGAQPGPSEQQSAAQKVTQAAADASSPGTAEKNASASAAQPDQGQRPVTQRRFKRPGTKLSRNGTPSAVPTPPKPSLPPSLSATATAAEMDQLAEAMDRWTINEAAKKLDFMDQDKNARLKKPRSRIRPKGSQGPLQIINPELAAARMRAIQQEMSAPEVHDDHDASSDDDYVLETYERVPADRLRDGAVPAERVGLLVFDTEPERQEFYFANPDDGDSSDFEEEELENRDAECYTGNDYPEDESGPEDERYVPDYYDYHMTDNSYLYHRGSDNEEYDELGPLGEDDDDGGWGSS